MRFAPLSQGPAPVEPAEGELLASWLTEGPETVIPIYVLRRRLCTAWTRGTPPQVEAMVVQPYAQSNEPQAFGNTEAVWALLRTIPGWTCVDVSNEVAEGLAAEMEREVGIHPRLYGDVYHTLSTAPPEARLAEVRLLGLEDVPLLEAAPSEVQGGGWHGNPGAMLRDGLAAGAIIDNRVVAIAYAGAVTEHYADVGVATLEPWRNRGLSTAAASLVARGVLSQGRTPVWSAGEDNFASLRVAQKLGFKEVARRTYLILPE